MTGSEIVISSDEIRKYMNSKGYGPKKPDYVIERAREAKEFYETEARLQAKRREAAAPIKRAKRVEKLKRALVEYPGSNADAKARDAAWLAMSTELFPVDHVADVIKRRRYDWRKRAGAPSPREAGENVRVKSVASMLKAWALARPTDTRALIMRIKDEFAAIAKSYIRLVDLRKELGRNPSPNEFAAAMGGKCKRMWAIDRLMLLGVLEESDGPFRGVTI